MAEHNSDLIIPMQERSISKDYRMHLLFMAITALLTVFAYSNVLHGDPQFDDERYIFENARLKSPSDFKDHVTTAQFFSGSRLVTEFTFSLNHFFWGKDTYSYHLTNLFIHIFNGILVYIFIYMTLKMPFVREGYSDKAHWVAFFTSLVFSIHPIQTQAVSYIVQRGESLASMFYMISMVFFVAAAKAKLLKRNIFMLLFVASFIMGLGSKPIAVTLPLVAILYGICFFEKRGLCKKILVPSIILIAGIIFSLGIILNLSKSQDAGYHIEGLTVLEYVLTQFRVVFTYLRMLFLPVGQSLDHLYPVSRSFLEFSTMLSFSAILLLFALAWIFYKKHRIVSFFILWFFIILLPSSSIVPLKDVIFEHRLYLPSLAVYFIFVSSLFSFFQWINCKVGGKMLVAFFLVSAMSFAVLMFSATYHRNSIWKSRLSMWQDVVRKYPKNPRGIHNLANCYFIVKNYEYALRYYLMSLNVSVENVELYYNAGQVFERIGMHSLARDFFVHFFRYSDGGYYGIKKTLSLKYGIDNNTPPIDITQLKNRAISAYNEYFTSKG